MKARRTGVAGLLLSLAACAPPPAKTSEAPHLAPALPVPPLCTSGGSTWAADGSLVLAWCQGGLELREGASGTVRAQRATREDAAGSVVSHDGAWVAVPQAGRVELRSGRDLSLHRVLVLSPDAGAAPLLTFSPDGTRLAALLPPGLLVEASIPDGNIRWQLDGAAEPRLLPTRLRYVGDAIHISVDLGRPVVVAQGKRVSPRWARAGGSVDVNADGSRLLVSSRNGDTTLWDVATDRPLTALAPHYARRRWLGQYIGATPSGELQLARGDVPAPLLRVPGAEVLDAVVTPDGHHLRTATKGELREWELPRLAQRHLAWRPEPSRELVAGGFVLERAVDGLTLRRLSDRRVVAQMRGNGADFKLARGTPRGEIVALRVGDDDKKQALCIAGSGAERTLELTGFGRALAVDPQAPRVAYVVEHTIHVVDSASLKELATFPNPPHRQHVEFRSPQNQLVLFLGPGKLTFLDLKSGQTVLEAELRPSYAQLVVSPNGEYVGLSGTGVAHLWSNAGVKDWSDPSWLGFAFAQDSRSIRLLTAEKIVTKELPSGRTLREEALPKGSASQLIGDHALLRQEGAQAGRDLARGPSRSLAPPEFARLQVLGFRAGALLAFDQHGSLLKWPMASLHIEKPQRVDAGAEASLSPNGSLLGVQTAGYGGTVDLYDQENLVLSAVQAWSLDGRASISRSEVSSTDGDATRLTVPGAIGFAGDASLVLASPAHDLLLYDTRSKAAPRTLATHARLAAQSGDQLTLAVVTERGQNLALLRAPTWNLLGAPLAINGAQQVALTETGDQLAVLNESNELELHSVGRSGVSEASARYRLPAAPAVKHLLYTPDARFLVLEGTPLRFLRLRDGEVLNAFVARSDSVERLEAPLLFVNQHGELEGDVALAPQLYCESAAEEFGSGRAQRPSTCTMPRVSPGLVARFFAPAR